jgi:hypothetical protein
LLSLPHESNITTMMLGIVSILILYFIFYYFSFQPSLRKVIRHPQPKPQTPSPPLKRDGGYFPVELAQARLHTLLIV